MTLERLGWKETFARLRSDHRRLVAVLNESGDETRRSAFSHPSLVCVFLHRVSSHFFRSGHRHMARFFWHLNILLTGADISLSADLGEGLVIVNPTGISISAKVGVNLTMMPCSGLGAEVGRRQDIGAGPGLPVLGDDVFLEPHSGALGPVRIGDRVRLAAWAIATSDVPDDSVAEGPRVRAVRRRDLP